MNEYKGNVGLAAEKQSISYSARILTISVD